MFISDCLSVNGAGHLTIGGCDTVELAAEYGTPLYVMDEQEVRAACGRYKRSMDEHFDGRGLVAYASKAFCCKAMCRIIADEGMGLDVVSGGELYTALSAGFPAEKIFFHGNNKTPEELTFALSENVGRIVVDNIFELELLNQMAISAGKTVSVLIRVKPGIDPHTHDFVKTGGVDSKFGMGLETGEAFEAVKRAISYKNISLTGIHCHIGSQIFDVDPFVMSARVMLDFIEKIKHELGYTLDELNLGGGYAVQYIPDQEHVEYGKYLKNVSEVVKSVCAEKGLVVPYIIIEPGRSIAGLAGITLYKVGSVKEIPGIRTYVSVDGGMADNPRYALYKAEYDMVIANKASQPKSRVVTVAGKCCESGDLLGENIAIQDVNDGDILAVLTTGAFNYSMSSNYNRIPKPAVIMIKDGKPEIIVKRETMEDIIRNDL